VQKWSKRDAKKKSDRSARHFFVAVKEIRDNKYELSLNRYRKVAHEEVNHVSPAKLLGELKELEDEMNLGLGKLEGLLK
jgi:type I restriction enzyme M protein